jgi:hypothetical protein
LVVVGAAPVITGAVVVVVTEVLPADCAIAGSADAAINNMAADIPM